MTRKSVTMIRGHTRAPFNPISPLKHGSWKFIQTLPTFDLIAYRIWLPAHRQTLALALPPPPEPPTGPAQGRRCDRTSVPSGIVPEDVSTTVLSFPPPPIPRAPAFVSSVAVAGSRRGRARDGCRSDRLPAASRLTWDSDDCCNKDVALQFSSLVFL